jgi:hypothetical protein
MSDAEMPMPTAFASMPMRSLEIWNYTFMAFLLCNYIVDCCLTEAFKWKEFSMAVEGLLSWWCFRSRTKILKNIKFVKGRREGSELSRELTSSTVKVRKRLFLGFTEIDLIIK